MRLLWLESCVLLINSSRLRSFFNHVLFLDWFFFSISTFNNKLLKIGFHNFFFIFFLCITILWLWLRVSYVNFGWLKFFYSLSVRLSWSHDSSHKFNRLTRVKFFCYFLINPFQSYSSTLGWLRIEFHNFFWIALYRVIMI